MFTNRIRSIEKRLRWLEWKLRNRWFMTLMAYLEMTRVLIKNRFKFSAFSAEMTARLKTDEKIEQAKRRNRFLLSQIEGYNAKKTVRRTGNKS